MKGPELLGFHGLTLAARDPRKAARLWAALLGLPVLSRNARGIVLGAGPEIFVAIRAARAGEPEGVVEVHVAVKRIAPMHRKTAADPLGGESFRRNVERLGVVVRELKRAPSATWRKRRSGA